MCCANVVSSLEVTVLVFVVASSFLPKQRVHCMFLLQYMYCIYIFVYVNLYIFTKLKTQVNVRQEQKIPK